MKNLIVISLIIVSSFNYLSGQSKELNCIFLIDSEIPEIGSISIRVENDTTYSDWLKYLPGKIIFSSDAVKMLESENEQASISIEYSDIYKRKQNHYTYKIEFNQSWLSSSYVIIRIYNRNKKYNRRKYRIPRNQKHIYQIDLPGNSIMPMKM